MSAGKHETHGRCRRSIVIVGVAVLALLAAAGAAIALYHKSDKGPALYSLASGTGLSVEMSRTGSDYDGFWCWPDRKQYGRLRGESTRLGRFSLDLVSMDGKKHALEGRLRFSGDIEGEFTDAGAGSSTSTPPKTAIVLRNIRERGASISSSMKIAFVRKDMDVLGRTMSAAARRKGKADASDGSGGRLSESERTVVSGFSLGMLVPDNAATGALFDGTLRRGRNPEAYAARLEDSFSKDIAALRGADIPQRSLEFRERQFSVGRGAKFLSVMTERYYFSGGAHGNTVASFRVFDMEAGKALDLSDILSGSIESLETPLLQEARRSLELEDGEALTAAGFFENDLPLSSDWFACASGLGFQYDRYELAPYAMGEFYFVIPWGELAGLVDPAFADAFAVSGTPPDTM